MASPCCTCLLQVFTAASCVSLLSLHRCLSCPCYPQRHPLTCCSMLCCRALSNTFYPSISAAPVPGPSFTTPLQTAWSLEALMGASLNL